MKVTLAVTADYANVTKEGKLNILGIFDTIKATSFPCTHPALILVFKLEAGMTETGRNKKVEVQLMDEDGTKLMSIMTDITIGPVRPGELFTTGSLLTFQNLVFPKPGTYVFDIFIDNQPREEGRVPLKVVQIAKNDEESRVS